MPLSYELISQFAKLAAGDKKTSTESTVYGTIKVDGNGNKYVKLDGSDQLTPLTDDEQPSVDSSSVNANDGERVSVLIKNHTATVTGNISSPAARTDDVEDLEDQVSEIQEFDVLVAKQLQAQEGYIKQLQTDKANVGELKAATAKITELENKKASIEDLDAAKAEITDLKTTKLDADVANITYATVENLNVVNQKVTNVEAKHGKYEQLTTERFESVEAEIESLNVNKLDVTWANIDFADIDKAVIAELFAESGIIKDLVVSEGTITGELVGVTIKGDLIEAGTLKADRLVVRGSDGNYYKLNTNFEAMEGVELVEEDAIHGSVIIAKSITAEKVAVDDLVAFGATIGGFHIDADAIYSGVKDSIDSSTPGIYTGADGQVAIGDDNNYVKFHKNDIGEYKLEVSLIDNLEIGARNLIRNSTTLAFEDYYFRNVDESISAIAGKAVVGLAIVGKG